VCAHQIIHLCKVAAILHYINFDQLYKIPTFATFFCS